MAATRAAPASHRRGTESRAHSVKAQRRRLAAIAALAVLAIALLAFPKVTSSQTAALSTRVTTLPGQTPMNAPFSAGTTVGGYTCGPGIRQVPWSAYAPACEPKWSGNNGGATAPGVTATTITLSYREAATAILQELYALVPPSVVGTNAEAIQTMQSYINIFNKDFELYGRHVVLAPFNGQGNFINEDTGTGAPQAEADAVTVATSLHAFADMSLIDSSVTYTQDLQAQKVIAFGLYLQDQQWYQQNAPWQYTPGPNCSKSANAIGALFGKQLKGLPAQFAGGALRTEPRKLGIFYTNVPTQYDCEQQVVKSLASYGVTPVAQAALTFNIANLASESSTAVAQMKAAGATTIICVGCDPISPRFYFAAATQDNYHPEWFFQSLYASNATASEAFIRLFPADQRSQILTIGTQPTAKSLSEAVHAYQLGNTDPGATIIPSYYLVYGSILQFFSALQLAGPDLTPSNFQAAMRSIPQSSPGGELGGWNGSAGPYDPASTFQILKWDQAARSPADGHQGTYEVCNGGAVYSFASPALPARTPLRCALAVQKRVKLGTIPGASIAGSTGSSAGSAGSVSTSASVRSAGASGAGRATQRGGASA